MGGIVVVNRLLCNVNKWLAVSSGFKKKKRRFVSDVNVLHFSKQVQKHKIFVVNDTEYCIQAKLQFAGSRFYC